MVTRSEAIPSKYLKADDFIGKRITVTISYAQMEKMGEDEKLVLYFEGKQKGLALNKTNSNFLFDELGEDTSEWVARRVTFFTERKMFQGKFVNGFSFSIPDDAQPTNGSAAQPPARPKPTRVNTRPDSISTSAAHTNDDMGGDEIPF